MSLDEFINKYNGLQITDPWGGFLGECVSLWKRYAREVQGVDPNLLYVPDGAAKNIWFMFTDAMAAHYDKVPTPQRGDAAIYDGSYGDVAIVVSPTQVFGQLGTPVFRPAAVRNIGNPLGYIRLKGVNMEELETLRQIASVRRDNLSRLEQAAGVDTGKIEPDNGVDAAIANIDAKNKQIDALQTKLSTAQAVNGDAGKWQTLKVLLKELLT